jgi:hypothetical protein
LTNCPTRVCAKQAVRGLCAGLTEVAITVNSSGVEHWKTIETQELFARHRMPHVAPSGAR